MNALDPLSQLVGGLSAQVQGLSAALIDLRSEIVTNRQQNQARWEDLAGKIDLVQAEYRNVKHSERSLEQEKVLVANQLREIDKRLTEIEGVILVWRTRVAMLVGLAALAGAAFGYVLQVATILIETHLWGKA